MGEVFRADDEQQDRPVALKILSAKSISDPKAVDRFQREAKAISALKHPNIIELYEIGESEFGHFMAMELVEGRPLRFLIGEKAAEQQADGITSIKVSPIWTNLRSEPRFIALLKRIGLDQ